MGGLTVSVILYLAFEQNLRVLVEVVNLSPSTLNAIGSLFSLFLMENSRWKLVAAINGPTKTTLLRYLLSLYSSPNLNLKIK